MASLPQSHVIPIRLTQSHNWLTQAAGAELVGGSAPAPSRHFVAAAEAAAAAAAVAAAVADCSLLPLLHAPPVCHAGHAEPEATPGG